MVVVLAGSLVGVMHRGILGGGAPLYGRASYRIKLGELRLRDIRVMHADMKLEDVFLAYSVFGGIPFYHVLLREYRDVAEALWDLFLSQAARLRDEVGFMLREEFREPSTYYSVLRAVALGADSPSRIAEITGMHRQHVGKYLAVLEELGLVGREVPVFSKKGRYVIKDKLLMTWFNIVEPIAMRDPSPSRDGVLPEIKEKMHLQASRVFEEVARRFAVAWGRMQGARFDTVGRFVHKGVEIDVIGIINDRKEIHLFEAKWSDLDFTEARRIITGLERRAAYLPQSLADYTIFPHVIARECTGCEALKEDNAFVHSLDEVVELT